MRSSIPGRIELVVLLDVSHSMTPSQMDDARAFLRCLIDALTAEDRFTLLTFGDDPKLVVEAGAAKPDARIEWLAALDRLETEDKTDLSAALDRASSISTKGSRWLLVTDGFPHWGDVSPDGLRRRVSGKRPLWTVGVGRTNEDLLRELASAGGGTYFHLESPAELASVVLPAMFGSMTESQQTETR